MPEPLTAQDRTPEPESLQDLVRFLAETVTLSYEALMSSWELPPAEAAEYLKNHYPIVQTTRLQNALRDIGRQQKDSKKAGEAVRWMLANADRGPVTKEQER